VVVDDVCFGTRFYWADVGKTEDPLDGLVDRYLDKILCPRTYRQSPGTHQADLDNRFRYLRAAVRDFQVNGIILAVVRYCETHAHDAPDVRDYLRETGLPVLQLEYEYSMMSIAPLRTRIQAFLELIGEK
jgi:benzoyl-CoA reductase/2-hydroxyglutaryl-CoA dehydratase subunit BcrC/BadD/HgdB